MKIYVFGGCDEIGLNMTVLEESGVWIAVDCGVTFPDDSLPGIDLIRPDVSWLRENKISLTAWFFTHGHEDHIGALPALLCEFPAPLYCSRVTAAFILEKFKEFQHPTPDIRELDSGVETRVESFRITPLGLHHSIPESFGFYIATRSGALFMTGDFRFEFPQSPGLGALDTWRRFFSEKTIDVMMCDSTNAKSSGKDRIEDDLLEEFLAIMRQSDGVVVFVSFASNLWRLRSILLAAREVGRRVVPLGRSVQRGFDIGLRCGVIEDENSIVTPLEEIAPYSSRQLCVVASGSQGETFSGASRLALGECREIRLGEGDVVVFSARTIPGNESGVAWMQERFLRRGVEVITQADRLVHVSGHAFADDIRESIDVVKPRYFVPVHGDYLKRRANASVAISAGFSSDHTLLVDNGSCIEIENGLVSVVPQAIATGRVHVSEGVEIPSPAIRERQKLARAGIVFVSLVLCSHESGPRYVVRALCRGVPWDAMEVQLTVERILEKMLPAFKKLAKSEASFEDVVGEKVRLAVRQALERRKDGFRTNVAVTVQSIC